MGIRTRALNKQPSFPLAKTQRNVLIAVSLVAIIVVSLFAYLNYYRNPNTPTIKAATSPEQVYPVFADFFGTTPYNIYPWVVAPSLSWYGTSNCPAIGCWGPSSASSIYGQNLNDSMTLSLSLANFTRLELNFHLWLNIEPTDALRVDFRNSTTWTNSARYSGHVSNIAPQNQSISSAWMNETLFSPSPIEAIRFTLITGCCGITSDGLFLSQLSINGIGPSGYEVQELIGSEPITPCNFPSGGCQECTFPACARGADPVFLHAPVKIDGGTFHQTPAYFLVTRARHTFIAVNSFSSDSTSFSFQYWSYFSPFEKVNSTTFTVSVIQSGSTYVYYNAVG